MTIIVYVWADESTCVMRRFCHSWNEVMEMMELAGNRFPVLIHEWPAYGTSVDITVGD